MQDELQKRTLSAPSRANATQAWLPRFLRMLLALAFLSLTALFFHALVFRFPTDHELRKRFPTVSIVDTSQSDIGMIGVEEANGERSYIELVPQWVMPWESYDWAKGGYPE